MGITTYAKKIKAFMNTPETFIIELVVMMLIFILIVFGLLTGRLK